MTSSTRDAVIALEAVSKAFTPRRSPLNWLTGGQRKPGYQALTDISLEIRPGETVGLLGVNGAGKSTLLQLIAGTMSPSAGSIRVSGRISALLELGAGFNPEWTGRLNAEFYSRIQGVPKAQIADVIRSIEAFADVGAFFDQPMRTYSSGMFLRVAFAAAIAVEPDIVIVDEALAVGDARFQNKCFARIKQMQDAGKTILFVTHDVLTMNRFCTRGIVLSQGHLIFDGAPDDAVKKYRALLYGDVSSDQVSAPLEAGAVGTALTELSATQEAPLGDAFSWPPDLNALKAKPYYNENEGVAGNAPGQIVDIRLIGGSGAVVPKGRRIQIAIQIQASVDVDVPSYGILVKSKDNVSLYGTTNILLGQVMPPIRRGEVTALSFEINTDLARGDYFVDVGFASIEFGEQVVLEWRMSVVHFTIESPTDLYGYVDLNASLRPVTSL